VDSGFDIRVNSTALLADMAGQGALPDQAMITVHPQRWNDRAVPWVRELVWQNVKNGVKRVGVRLGLRVTLGYWVIERGGVSLALLRF
jgi:hypothetical protein